MQKRGEYQCIVDFNFYILPFYNNTSNYENVLFNPGSKKYICLNMAKKNPHKYKYIYISI